MIKQIESVKKARAVLLESIKDLSVEQLNSIPTGLNNNVIWNLGHMIVVQQGVCYNRAGLPGLINYDFREKFKPGSKPEGIIGDAEIAHIKQMLFVTLERLDADYDRQIFVNYTPWSTRFGVEVTSIDDGIQFLLFHEGLHSDAVMAIKGFVVK